MTHPAISPACSTAMTNPVSTSTGGSASTAPQSQASKAIEEAAPFVTVTTTVNGTNQARTIPVQPIVPIPVEGKRSKLWSLFELSKIEAGATLFKCIACSMAPQSTAGTRMQKHLEECTSFHWKERIINGETYSIVPQHLAAKRFAEKICVWVDGTAQFSFNFWRHHCMSPHRVTNADVQCSNPTGTGFYYVMVSCHMSQCHVKMSVSHADFGASHVTPIPNCWDTFRHYHINATFHGQVWTWKSTDGCTAQSLLVSGGGI